MIDQRPGKDAGLFGAPTDIGLLHHVDVTGDIGEGHGVGTDFVLNQGAVGGNQEHPAVTGKVELYGGVDFSTGADVVVGELAD